MTDARTFLATRAEALCEGLRSRDPARMAAAAAAHHDSRPQWAEVLRHSPADELTALYALHGRLAASLELGLDGWLRAEAAHLVRLSQVDRLIAGTAAVVDHVGSSDERRGEWPWPAPTGSPTPSTRRSAATRRAARSASV